MHERGYTYQSLASLTQRELAVLQLGDIVRQEQQQPRKARDRAASKQAYRDRLTN